MGFESGPAFVEQVVRERGVGFAEGLGKGLGLRGLRALGAVSVERVADDERGDVMLADEARNGFQISEQVWFRRAAMDGEERLRGEAELVGNGETDAAVANVEGEDASGNYQRLRLEDSVLLQNPCSKTKKLCRLTKA